MTETILYGLVRLRGSRVLLLRRQKHSAMLPARRWLRPRRSLRNARRWMVWRFIVPPYSIVAADTAQHGDRALQFNLPGAETGRYAVKCSMRGVRALRALLFVRRLRSSARALPRNRST